MALQPIKVPAKNKYKTPYAVLVAAKKLLSKKRNWIQGELAMNCHGRKCPPRSGRAIAVCSIGAVNLIDGPAEEEALDILTVAARTFNMKKYDFATLAENVYEYEPDTGTIVDVNDYGSFSIVHKMFRRAIAYAKDRNFLKKLDEAKDALIVQLDGEDRS